MANISHNENSNAKSQSMLVEKFLENQTKELEVRQQIEENRKQSAKYNFELAKQSLQAQIADRKEEREQNKTVWKWFIIFLGFSVSIIVIFSAWALFLGKENFLLEIVKIVIYGTSGALAGASWEKLKQKSDTSSKKNSDE